MCTIVGGWDVGVDGVVIGVVVVCIDSIICVIFNGCEYIIGGGIICVCGVRIEVVVCEVVVYVLFGLWFVFVYSVFIVIIIV